MENLSIDQLHNLRLAIFSNAENLHKEAKLLWDNGFYARAYLLSHLACEELGKIPIVVGVIGILMQQGTPDFKKAMKRFRSHQAKIDSDDFHHYVFGIDCDLISDTDLKWIATAKAELKSRVDLKNLSTYVDFDASGPVSPIDAVSKDKAGEMLGRAFKFLRTHWNVERVTNPVVVAASA